MSTQSPTNAELAGMFFSMMMRTSTSPRVLLDAKKRIAECPFHIAERFASRRTLRNSHIPKLWKEHYRILEKILRKGVEKTGDALVRDDIESQMENAFKGIPGSSQAKLVADDSSPGWQNVVRAIEE